MALGIDTTRAFRFHDEILHLVEAVTAANSADESTWIEWKGSLDLTQENAFHHLPRHVLGFANREPGGAALNAEGHAYLIIGAEPGDVPGIAPIDPGDLSSRLRAYVGERIVWHPQYVTVQGKQVLVIAVDPPRAGDSIHPLRKQMQNMQPGTILIRLPGQTVQARPDHIAMLESRAKASANTADIGVRLWGASRIERAADLEPFTTPRVEEMRQRLKAKGPAESVDWNSGRVQLSDAIAGMFIDTGGAELAKYTEDVELYLNKWTRVMKARRDILLDRHAPSHLKFTVRNNTDRNYLAVRVTVFVPGAYSPDLEDRRWPPLPAEPTPPARNQNRFAIPAEMLGMSVLAGHDRIPQFPFTPDFAVPALKVAVAPERTLRKSHGPGGLLLEYPELDLRPRQELFLQSVALDILDAGTDAISVQWDVTAKNADGKLEGGISIPVVASTMDLSGIFGNPDDSADR